MGIARSTYYEDPKGSADDTALVETMHAIKDEFEAYGWRRMQAALRHRGWIVNHKKVKRLMREHALHPPRRRRFVATTDSDHDEPVFSDRSRDCEADGPNQLWVADLTYIYSAASANLASCPSIPLAVPTNPIRSTSCCSPTRKGCSPQGPRLRGYSD